MPFLPKNGGFYLFFGSVMSLPVPLNKVCFVIREWFAYMFMVFTGIVSLFVGVALAPLVKGNSIALSIPIRLESVFVAFALYGFLDALDERF